MRTIADYFHFTRKWLEQSLHFWQETMMRKWRSNTHELILISNEWILFRTTVANQSLRRNYCTCHWRLCAWFRILDIDYSSTPPNIIPDHRRKRMIRFCCVPFRVPTPTTIHSEPEMSYLRPIPWEYVVQSIHRGHSNWSLPVWARWKLMLIGCRSREFIFLWSGFFFRLNIYLCSPLRTVATKRNYNHLFLFNAKLIRVIALLSTRNDDEKMENE